MSLPLMFPTELSKEERAFLESVKKDWKLFIDGLNDQPELQYILRNLV